MRTHLPPKYSWTDDQLIAAVTASACWRDVVRALGIATNSESVNRRVKKDVIRLGLDVSHFKGTRTWDDAQLIRAVADAKSWDEVYTALGLHTPTKGTRVRVAGNAMRLGLSLTHLDVRPSKVATGSTWQVDPMRLRDCATSLAAAWFTLREATVSLPQEGAVYDLVVDPLAVGMLRVQVKSTIRRPDEVGAVSVSRRPYSVKNLAPRLPYDPKIIDYFFIVDGDYNLYLIPSLAVAGRLGITLRTYKKYIVGNAQGLLGMATEAGRAGVPASA